MLIILGGCLAGFINGLFGTGGGMILIPLLSLLGNMKQQDIFPTSISIIFPICLIALFTTAIGNPLPWAEALPYLIGGTIGGILAALTGKKIPVKWLHRFFGIMILIGGIRYLC